MSEKDASDEFELVFEGTVDDSIETLQKLKGVFIADLDLSIPEVQSILENAPITIKRAKEELELKPQLAALKSAGAKVYIVRPSAEEEEATSSEAEQPQQEESETATELEFDLDADLFSSHLRNESWDSPDGRPASIPSKLISSSKSGQCIP